MEYHIVDPDSIPETPDYPCNRRSITENVGLDMMAVAIYTVAPGEQLATDYHYHESREEVFYVIDGCLQIETPNQVYRVTSGELFVVKPGNPIRPFNPSDAEDSVTVLGVGAPRYDIGREYEF